MHAHRVTHSEPIHLGDSGVAGDQDGMAGGDLPRARCGGDPGHLPVGDLDFPGLGAARAVAVGVCAAGGALTGLRPPVSVENPHPADGDGVLVEALDVERLVGGGRRGVQVHRGHRGLPGRGNGEDMGVARACRTARAVTLRARHGGLEVVPIRDGGTGGGSCLVDVEEVAVHPGHRAEPVSLGTRRGRLRDLAGPDQPHMCLCQVDGQDISEGDTVSGRHLHRLEGHPGSHLLARRGSADQPLPDGGVDGGAGAKVEQFFELGDGRAGCRTEIAVHGQPVAIAVELDLKCPDRIVDGPGVERHDELGPGVRADDTVHLQAVGGLETLHRGKGVRAEDAVRGNRRALVP